MGRFGLIGSSYRSQSILADCQMTMNWYEEVIESGEGRSAKAMYPRPGLNLLYNIGGAGGRGVQTFLGRSFAVMGTSFVELLAPNLSPNFTNWSTATGTPIASDGGPVSMAFGGHQILIASRGLAYVFDMSAGTLVQVDPSAGGNYPVIQVAYSDGIFLALVQPPAPAVSQINQSNLLDATTWQGVAFTQVSVFPDNPNGIFTSQRLLWVFGPDGIQPYANTGDFPFAFDVIPGTYIEDGLGAPASVAKGENGPLFWLSTSKRGGPVVKMAQGFTPTRISDHALEFAIQSYATYSDAIGICTQDQGHPFYELHFPSANVTWVFDLGTRKWHQRGFWNTLKGSFDRTRGTFHTFNFGMHLRLDPTVGSVYQESINIYSDFGNAIRRIRRAPHISKEQKRIRHSRIQIDAEVGIGPNFPNSGVASSFTLQDSSGTLWTVKVTDFGVLQAVKGSTDASILQYFIDPATNTNWQITVTTLGVIAPVSTTYPAVQAALKMTSITGDKNWLLTVRQVSPGIAQLVTSPIQAPGRGPLWTLRWSDDGAQTWSNEHPRNGGMIGDYRQRLLWNRLGLARDRVYELSIEDPAPARVIDAYLEADDYQPSERSQKQYAKMA